MRNTNPRSIFLTRLWAFLNYRTRIRLTWLELLTASGVGLMFVWIGLRNWSGLVIFGPLALYLLLLGFYQELRIPVGWIRALHDWLWKPLDVKPEPQKKQYARALLGAVIVLVLLPALIDIRLSILFALLALAG